MARTSPGVDGVVRNAFRTYCVLRQESEILNRNSPRLINLKQTLSSLELQVQQAITEGAQVTEKVHLPYASQYSPSWIVGFCLCHYPLSNPKERYSAFDHVPVLETFINFIQNAPNVIFSSRYKGKPCELGVNLQKVRVRYEAGTTQTMSAGLMVNPLFIFDGTTNTWAPSPQADRLKYQWLNVAPSLFRKQPPQIAIQSDRIHHVGARALEKSWRSTEGHVLTFENEHLDDVLQQPIDFEQS